MIVATDVQYDERSDRARAAAIGVSDPSSTLAILERTVVVRGIAPYEPGAFFKRELPCLLAVLTGVAPTIVIVDGHAELDGRPGLGAHLATALGLPVIGVAKSAFPGARARPLLRGRSARPLWVSAAGMRLDDAAALVASLAGAHRLPTLLQRVDQLARAPLP